MSNNEDTIRQMLPKAYSCRKHVAHEVSVALSFFKGLVPVMDEYVYNDGTKKNLMCLTGTIPVIYSDKRYNIPICLWIEDNYPQTAPFCFVRPTRDMMILKGKHISNNGEVLLPYMEEWRNESDLISLLQVMVAMFGEFPPVCMLPPSELEQASCRRQFQREGDLLTELDGKFYLSLNKESESSFQQDETNC